ncbi:ABC transporter ATP-binding protein [Pseudonocardia sp. KRD-184]|uniref:ABC transporter ATP-binding protein n=1 Tax=Pseudonocardia oceani TaxID=2792013 RepID=A0ABS6U4N2_9PSEU|nr:ABC transporter ATP-binding protein [Pseudonocardia oceani]MBW0091373.1 ABC transporter ATP-binding protein [Pseudonocardia oceani]MBW0098462.1 ABC transporter ATP-binding protein [Pseudonocardia oceani]MBW0111028.1 ABC transporter ATP-binding protein [Pseudonocardia oceani]MBW0125009.1 ABC transporter ATP-binding protein [Pseudonocardia oceani]MBW0127212.1 ABC transporter ATP-binding protein [Pseudonocardia oceani]
MTGPAVTGPAVNLLPIATGARTRGAVTGLVRPYRLLSAATVLTLVAAAVALLAVPPLLGRIVDVAIAGAGSVDGPALGILVALVLRALLAAVAGVLVARLGEQVLAGLRERVVDRALQVRLADVERAGSGDLLQRVGGDISVISEAVRQAIPMLVIAGLDVVLTLVGLALLDWRLALAGLVPLPIWILATRWYARVSGPLYAAERVAEGDRTQSLLAGVGGAATVRAYRLRAPLTARIDGHSAQAVAASMRAMTAQSRFGAVLNGAEMTGVLAILVVGFWLVRADAVTVGAATAAALYFLRLFDPIGAVLFLLDEAQSAGAALARLVGVTDMPVPPAPRTPREPRDGGVRLVGVRHAYDGGPEVLHGVDLEIAPGERVAVVGPSGAGKTTLGAVLAGVHAPTAGTVEIGGVPLAELDRPRRHVAVVTQEVHVFAGTVADNLRLARPDATDAELVDALARVGAPLAPGDEVGDGGGEIGATQAQLLALARLLLADPAVAVLDEATAEAGSAGARVLEVAADAVLAGRTSVVVAHRLTQARAADRIVVLDKGRVVESGPHDELVERGGPYAELWKAWSSPRG